MYVHTRKLETHSVQVYWNNEEDEKPRIPFTSIAQQCFAADLLSLTWSRVPGQPWTLIAATISGRVIKHNGHLSPYGRHVDLRRPDRLAELPIEVRNLIVKIAPKDWDL